MVATWLILSFLHGANTPLTPFHFFLLCSSLLAITLSLNIFLHKYTCVGALMWLACWPHMQATRVQVPVKALIQSRNGVPRQFRSCLKWRFQANKLQREGWLVVCKTNLRYNIHAHIPEILLLILSYHHLLTD